ncbi:hypothetical protein N9868_01095 [Akkermansiaceae bacterium]|nr:hypothetical protein [Akkermansiaceae bacterium]MDB4288794.1 hypothetical protein [bacterium]MDA7863924.1 hypothetical protein [Akkermansiaceae bacterium]MDB4257962.1 hypothetical protein [Akkermansiaceae bacterium]MDB4258885.1 hypothetical protein [Akkermansiaceae bacterium]
MKRKMSAIQPGHDRARTGGFALISSLSLLFLLTLIAVAFLGLATVQVRTHRVDGATEEARSNARLALMIALGELQREMGPDQRVSAEAAIVSTSDSEKGVLHRHWTGVWSTQINGESPWARNDEEGGLHDLRTKQGWDAEKERRSYLVSGNEGGNRREGGVKFDANKPFAETAIPVLGEGSVGGDAADQVIVPKVGIEKKFRFTGNYGYWIGDLGVKANIIANSQGQEQDGQGASSHYRQFSPFPPQVEGLDGNKRDDSIGKIVSLQTLDLVSSEEGFSKDRFHEITVDSQGVLTNVRDGGLQKNLTAFLNGGTTADLKVGGELLALGLEESDNLVGPQDSEDALRKDIDWGSTRHRETSPKFGLLKDWSDLASTVSIDSQQFSARIPASEDQPKIPEITDAGFQNLNPATIASFDEANLSPIVVEGSIYETYSSHRNPPGSERVFNLRVHLYPRVVLWNPYNVPLTLDESIALIQVNGRRGFNTDVNFLGSPFNWGEANWLVFGGRNNEVSLDPVNSDAYKDPYTGSYYFTIPETTFQPGDCLVFTTEAPAEYGRENIARNRLSCEVEPSPEANYYITAAASEIDAENGTITGGMNWFPTYYRFNPSDNWFAGVGQKTQGDDSQIILKKLGTQSTLAPEDFDNLPQIAAVSCSMQFGDGREPVEAWAGSSNVPMEMSDFQLPRLVNPPDFKARQGYRLRWFREHESHLQIFGDALAGEPHWEESFLGTWNLRSAYATRTPWDNLAGNQGDGTASGPWFFGIYTRDLYDEAVGWAEQTPFLGDDSRQHGNPFGKPVEGEDRYVLFDVPRQDVGIISLAQFQHAKVSEFVWHPSYAIGNSLVDPRLGPYSGQTGTAPLFEYADDLENGGFSKEAIGWADNAERGASPDSWARLGRALFQDYPNDETLVYDLSFELNHTLWDQFFLTSGNASQVRDFANDPLENPLPNSRLRLIDKTDEKNLNDLHQAARHLMVDGAFNVNSTSPGAWRALLSANRRSDGSVPFPRHLKAPGPEWTDGDSADGDAMWAGTRVLTEDEVEILSHAIVEQVKARGPFLGLSDFVNRRLVDGPLGEMGALEAAIQESGINDTFNDDPIVGLNNQNPLSDYQHPDNITDATRLEQTLKPSSKAWGAPAYLTQADLLQAVGSTLSARSDTFIIRTYGDSIENGKVVARAWCEAIVQRIPTPMNPDATGLNPVQSEKPNFGRRFVIKSFRWLHQDEV